jgi:type I site-specific restriction endonuclease
MAYTVCQEQTTTLTPEEKARETIDRLLSAAGWIVQNRSDANIDAGQGVAIREFSLGQFGEADYLLFVDGQAAGVVEAKKEGSTLVGVEIQTQKYSEGIPDALPAPRRPLPAEPNPRRQKELRADHRHRQPTAPLEPHVLPSHGSVSVQHRLP